MPSVNDYMKDPEYPFDLSQRSSNNDVSGRSRRRSLKTDLSGHSLDEGWSLLLKNYHPGCIGLPVRCTQTGDLYPNFPKMCQFLETLLVDTTTAIEYTYHSRHYFDIHGKRKPEDITYCEYFRYRTQSGFFGFFAPRKQLLIILRPLVLATLILYVNIILHSAAFSLSTWKYRNWSGALSLAYPINLPIDSATDRVGPKNGYI